MTSLLSTRGARLACALTSLCAFALAACAPAMAAASSSNTSSFANAFGANKPLNLTAGTAKSHVAAGSMSGTVVRTIIGLLIVIAVIYAITWIMRHARKSSNPAVGDGLTQIATLPLGTNRSVSLVRVGAELHMLGVAEHGITSIRIFTEEEAYELGLPFEPEDAYSSAGSRAPLQSLFNTLRRLTVR